MAHPFELDADELKRRIDEMVDVTFGDLQSKFLLLPRGNGLVDYSDFQDAYEVLKRQTNAFAYFDDKSLWAALREDSLVFVVIRTILGFSPPEWADLARSEKGSDVEQGTARTIDARVRQKRGLFAKAKTDSLLVRRVEALVAVAVEYITKGAPEGSLETIHRLNKFDTATGLESVQHAANMHVPYAVLLYERYLGRPFASHRDSVSGLVGDVMESAVEAELARLKISARKTKRAERVVGFDQAPDFFVPTEVSPKVIIEAKITSDDGTARDKVARILRLTEMRDRLARDGKPEFEVVACIDGRGFGIRRQDMKDMLLATKGKIFTISTLDKLVANTKLREFLPISP